MKFTPKQELFITEYLIDMNGTKAYLRAGYKVSNEVAKANASRLLTNASIKNIIDRKLKEKALENDVSAEFVLNGIKAIAINGIKEGDKLKAFELLGKHLKLFVDRQETEITGETVSTSKIDFSRFSVAELKEMLASAT